jgi:hypothetical protein
MNNHLIAVFVISLIFLLSGCDLSKKTAVGFEDEIYIVADSIEYDVLKESLQKAFEVQINTPLPEKLFTINRVSSDRIKDIENKKNIVILSTINSNSPTSKLINELIDEKSQRRFLKDKYYIHYVEDLWAKDQLVAIITAKGLDDLKFNIEKNKDSLLVTFQKKSDYRLKESLYNPKYEKKNIESKLLLSFGWIIYIHKDFNQEINDPKGKFVWFKSLSDQEKERSLFVHWIDSTSYLYLTPDSVKSIRNRITREFYRSNSDSSYVVLIDSLINTAEVSFNGHFALCTQGLWKNTRNNLVGPFINYLLYDEKKHRVYMLDGSVNAPKYYKRNLIQQVDVMLQSFRTTSDLSEDRIDELIEESMNQ